MKSNLFTLFKLFKHLVLLVVVLYSNSKNSKDYYALVFLKTVKLNFVKILQKLYMNK